MRRQTLRLQLFEDGDGLPLRPDHPHIARRSLHRPAQHSHIVAMPAGDDHDVGRFARRKLRRSLLEIFDDDLLRLRKAFAIGISLAIVDHGDVESGDARNLIKTRSHMTSAENIKIGGRQDRLDENLQRPSTDQAGVVLRILIQIKGQCAWPLRFHDIARRLPDLSLNAAAADGANNRAIVPHQHLGGLERRYRPADVNNGRYRPAASVFSQTDDFLVQVHAHDYGSRSREGQLPQDATVKNRTARGDRRKRMARNIRPKSKAPDHHSGATGVSPVSTVTRPASLYRLAQVTLMSRVLL